MRSPKLMYLNLSVEPDREEPDSNAFARWLGAAIDSVTRRTDWRQGYAPTPAGEKYVRNIPHDMHAQRPDLSWLLLRDLRRFGSAFESLTSNKYQVPIDQVRTHPRLNSFVKFHFGVIDLLIDEYVKMLG